MRVVVAVDGETTTRAAHSLSTHPGVDEVVLLGPATSAHFDTVRSVSGFDAVVGTEKAAVPASKAGLPAVVTGEMGTGIGISGASVEGLALALAVGVEAVHSLAIAIPGDPDGDESVTFPSPIDERPARRRRYDGHQLHVAYGSDELAAAMVLGETRHRVVVDHPLFMAGIALAAGVGVLLEAPVAEPTPVWTRAEPYLRAAVDMGLVIGERSP